MLTKTGTILAAAAIALAAATTSAAAEDCHSDNAAAGTVAGAIAGGIIGNQFGHGGGKAAATVGGVILGGVAGNAIAGNIDCNDRPYAYRAYRQGFDGRIGVDYSWSHGAAHGYIRPIRQYRRRGRVCRDFTVVTYRGGREYTERGVACRYPREGWRIE